MNNKFSNRLRDLRIRKGLSQAELAELIDEKLRPERYSLYETGKSVPRAKRLRRLAEVLGVEESWLIGDEAVAGSSLTGQADGASVLREAELRQLLLDAKETENAKLRQEVQDLRLVALDTFDFWDRFRETI